MISIGTFIFGQFFSPSLPSNSLSKHLLIPSLPPLNHDLFLRQKSDFVTAANLFFSINMNMVKLNTIYMVQCPTLIH